MSKKIKEQIKVQKEIIEDQNRLLRIWSKAPAGNEVKITTAKKKISQARQNILELEEELEVIKNRPEPPMISPNQLDMFPETAPPMIKRAFNNDVEVTNKAISKMIPDNVHQQDVIDDIGVKRDKNKSQNKQVAEFFQKHKPKVFTAWQVLDHLNWPVQRITSVRRAISDLTRADVLIKTDQKKKEREGELNFLYRAK